MTSSAIMENNNSSRRTETDKKPAKIIIKSIPKATDKNKNLQNKKKCKYNFENATTENGNKNTSVDDIASTYYHLSRVCSGLYAIHIVVLSLVMCLLHYVSNKISGEFVKIYFTILYTTCCIWIIVCKILATSCCRKQIRQMHITANHTTNRWLKALLIFFGIGIVVENAMEFIEYIYCPVDCGSVMNAVKPISQATFVVAQLSFFIHFSKVCILRDMLLNRFGIMHIIATNLSVWTLLIVMETAHKTHYHEYDDHYEYANKNMSEKYRNDSLHNSEDSIDQLTNCTCTPKYCEAVHSAQAFLYPFVIEFSLIASCLSYIIWNNVGKIPPHFEHVVKPNYNFFKSYKGFVGGSFALASTIVFITLFDATGEDLFNICTEYIAHHLYLIIISTVMLGFAVVGIYLLSKDFHGKTLKENNMDVIIIFITVTGSIASDICSVLYSCTGFELVNIWNIVSSIINIFQSVSQVLLISLGMDRSPSTTSVAENTAEHILRTIEVAHNISSDPGESEKYIRHHLNRLPGIAKQVNEGYLDDEHILEVGNDSTNFSSSECPSKGSKSKFEISNSKNAVRNAEDNQSTKNKISEFPVLSQLARRGNANEDAASSGVCMSFSSENESRSCASNNKALSSCHLMDRKTDIKNWNRIPMAVIAKSRVSEPDKTRLCIRDIAMFLLIANACMWIFKAIHETKNDLLHSTNYHSEIGFERDTDLPRAIINMICIPLTIFFRMHSSACLFEVWSYA